MPDRYVKMESLDSNLSRRNGTLCLAFEYDSLCRIWSIDAPQGIRQVDCLAVAARLEPQVGDHGLERREPRSQLVVLPCHTREFVLKRLNRSRCCSHTSVSCDFNSLTRDSAAALAHQRAGDRGRASALKTQREMGAESWCAPSPPTLPAGMAVTL
jgi:hypothetical protein